MRFFFYGSLLDPAMRARVLGPLARGLALEPARLEAWRRCRPRGRPWPVIRPCRAAVVEGALTTPLGAAARHLLAAYEGRLYSTRRVHVRCRSGRRVAALAFVPTAGRASSSLAPETTMAGTSPAI
jgi:hypothetical protein